MRFKPSGIRLRVWRAMREDQRQSALLCVDREQLRLKLLGFAAEAPPPSQSVGHALHAPPRRLARSRRTALHGYLEGWVQEDRTTASGRKYQIYISPFGDVFRSRAEAYRALGV